MHLTHDTVVLRSIIIIFSNYHNKWLYGYLVLIEAFNLVLTIYGSYMNFNDMNKLLVCYMEVPLLANFMFILIILGYIYIFRMLVTVLHFWFGHQIYMWMKRKWRCLSTHEIHLKEKFEVYTYESYVRFLEAFM